MSARREKLSIIKREYIEELAKVDLIRSLQTAFQLVEEELPNSKEKRINTWIANLQDIQSIENDSEALINELELLLSRLDRLSRNVDDLDEEYKEHIRDIDNKLKPIGYYLEAIQDDQVTLISTTFQGNLAITIVTFQGETISLEESVSDDTFLIDNSMLGHWEVFLASINLERGRKYDVSMFSPQLSSSMMVTLVVDKKTSQVSLGNEVLYCVVVNVDVFELSFYLFEGELVQYRDDNQGLLLKKHPKN